ncbi:hypothetical protein ACFL27_00285 [candidate division CSSED10-310 bacterium]|uniref:Type II toxin-antitoxin system PemK/MazF family toxin n=1 Tax=candidate division CSSED10-310 bacterium TaxID=2855610 RepID=A0ABV6YQY6_UNCC1
MIGSICHLPDPGWSGENPSRLDQPGVCLSVSRQSKKTIFSRGSDTAVLNLTRYGKVYTIIEPTSQNGLHRRTAFALTPTVFPARFNKIRLLLADRTVGALEDFELSRMQQELRRIFSYQ